MKYSAASKFHVLDTNAEVEFRHSTSDSQLEQNVAATALESTETHAEASVLKAKAKKLYSPPVLKVYGKIHTLTATVGFVSNLDGGAGGRNRTH